MNKIMNKFAKRFGWVIEVPVTQKCTHLEDEKYNGWTNRETWAVNLHVENDEFFIEMRDEMLSNLDQNDYFTTTLEDACRKWFDTLLDELEESHPVSIKRMREDIGSLWRVDWLEISTTWYCARTDDDTFKKVAEREELRERLAELEDDIEVNTELVKSLRARWWSL